jgi:hypothetical protein
MENETFAETLKIQLFYTDNMYKTLKKTGQPKFIEVANETIYVFELYGKFLNDVPLKKRKIYNDNILSWLCSVYDDLVHIEANKKIYTRATDKKKSDLRAIKQVIELVGSIPCDTEDAQTTYDLLHSLHYAIENDNSKQVLHDRYYPTPLTTKQPMKDIINGMVEDHRIKKSIKAIDFLIAKLPTYKNIL